MAKANYLGEIKKRMENLRKEFGALTEAYQILSAVDAGRGRKAKLPSLEQMVGEPKPTKKSGKGRGRPAGAKNKPGSKKPGPKPKAAKAEKVVKPAKTAKPAKSSKAAKAAPKVNASKPVTSKKAGKKSLPAKAKGKRTRIPDLSVKIQDMIGKTGRFVTNSQITDKLASLYPTKSRSDLGKYISVILANMKSRNELGVVTIDSKGNKMRSGLWGLSSWFDNGKPKADYLK